MLLTLIDFVLTDRSKKLNKIKLRIAINNLIFIVKYNKKPGYKFMLKKGSVFGGVMKFLRKEITAIRYQKS